LIISDYVLLLQASSIRLKRDSRQRPSHTPENAYLIGLPPGYTPARPVSHHHAPCGTTDSFALSVTGTAESSPAWERGSVGFVGIQLVIGRRNSTTSSSWSI